MTNLPYGALWCPHRENFLVLDIFFEALNYEAIEQKKAYDLAGLLGDSPHLPWDPEAQSSGSQPWEGTGLAGGNRMGPELAVGWLKGGMLLSIPCPTCPVLPLS